MNPRISNKRYTRKFIKLISSFGEFWAVKAVFKDYFFSTVFLMGKTNEKLDFLYIVYTKKLVNMSICAKIC